MKNQKIADAFEGLAAALSDVVDRLRDAGDDAPRNDWGADREPHAAVGREVEDADAPNDDDIVEVKAGDLWRLVNRSRKMIRLARQGKVPSQENRAPLCRSIKTLKQQGLVKKPRNLRDRD